MYCFRGFRTLLCSCFFPIFAQHWGFIPVIFIWI